MSHLTNHTQMQFRFAPPPSLLNSSEGGTKNTGDYIAATVEEQDMEIKQVQKQVDYVHCKDIVDSTPVDVHMAIPVVIISAAQL